MSLELHACHIRSLAFRCTRQFRTLVRTCFFPTRSVSHIARRCCCSVHLLLGVRKHSSRIQFFFWATGFHAAELSIVRTSIIAKFVSPSVTLRGSRRRVTMLAVRPHLDLHAWASSNAVGFQNVKAMMPRRMVLDQSRRIPSRRSCLRGNQKRDMATLAYIRDLPIMPLGFVSFPGSQVHTCASTLSDASLSLIRKVATCK